MNTKPTYVTFEQAKLLKEKGFVEKVHQYYQFIKDLSSKKDKTLQLVNSAFLVRESDAAMFPDEGKNGCEVAAYSDRIFRDYNFKNSDDFTSAPEQWQVVEWLKVNHGIWIQVLIGTGNPLWWVWQIYNNKTGEFYNEVNEDISFETPQQAYSAAFDYILTNLI